LNSGGLGLVNAAVNSLLGSMGTNATQQNTTDNSFNQIFDKKMQFSTNDKSRSYDVSKSGQVNRDETTVKDADYEKERDAHIKSDMQKPKKPIEKMAKEKVSSVSENKKNTKKAIAEDTDDTEAIEAVATEVKEEAEVDDKSVLKELMALLTNDELKEEEKLASINDMLKNLSEADLKVLENESALLKGMLLSINGSLESFESVLSNLMVDGESFASILENVDAEEGLSIENFDLVVEQETVDLEKVLLDESGVENQTEETEPAEALVANKLALDESVEETPKETKAEKLEAAAEKVERVITGSEVSADTNASRNMNKQSTTDTNQSFADSLKFHTATVKTATMKNPTVTNPFEEKIMQQVIKGTQISMNVGKDVSEMMIKLNPKDLGNVSLKISLKNDELIAEFNVENKTVKEVLESRLEDLKTALSDKGFNIQGLDVSVNQDANDQFKSYEEFIKQQKGKKKLESLDGIEGLVDLEETDKAGQWQTLETTSSEINTLA
jgi:flagellar hook-length control protein FliK